MAPFLRWPLFWLLLGAYSVAEQEPEFKLVCYYSNWAIYRPSAAKFTPENINPYLCTHLIYAFGGLSTRFEIKPFDTYNDIQQGNYKKFADLKRYNPKLKTMIAVGGWNEGSKKFSKMVASEDNRQIFVKSVMKFLRQHKFDGLDLDWEYPTFRDGSHPEDKEGYLELLRELRRAFDSEKLSSSKQRLLLTMAVPAGQQYIEQGYDVEEMIKEVDFLNLLTYDYYTTQEGSANHHSALYEVEEREDWDPKRLLNVDWTVNKYIELGAPSSKLVVGIPTYGRAFTLEDENENELGSTIKGSAQAGNSTREEGYLAYYEICKMVQSEDWHVEAPFPDSLGPYAYKGDQWVGYDDEAIVTKKAKYAVEHKLGGVMFWALDTDDFRGDCGEKSPLITAARKALLSTSSKTSKSAESSTARSTLRTTTITTTRPTTTTTTTPVPEVVTTESPKDVDDANYDDDDDDVVIPSKSQEQTPAQKKHENRINERSDPDQDETDRLTTPVPPTTPDPAPAVECKDEGFFPNPRDCRKYFWCLDSGPADLGIVPHHFTCPSGLHFNTFTDSCDYAENVKCKIKSPSATSAPTTARPKPRATSSRTTTRTTEAEAEVEDTTAAPSDVASTNPSIAQLLHLIKTLGGVEEVEKHLGLGDKEDSKAAESQTTKSPTSSRTTAAAAARSRTTTEKPPTTNVRAEMAKRRGSIRHRTAGTSSATTTEKSNVTKARRQRIRTTTEEPTTEKPVTRKRTRPLASRRQSTTTPAPAPEAIHSLEDEDSSVKYTTIQRTVARRPIADEEIEARIDYDKSTAMSSNLNPSDGLETFEATRIPGLFKYIPLVRGGATTESTLDIAEQLRRILSAAEKNGNSKSTNEDVSANESTNNVQITTFDVSTPSDLDSDPPPFENIGVHLDTIESSSELGHTSKAHENDDERNDETKKEPNVKEETEVDNNDADEVNSKNDITENPESKTRPSITTTAVTPRRKVVIRKRITTPRSTPSPTPKITPSPTPKSTPASTRPPRKTSTTRIMKSTPSTVIPRIQNISSNRSARPRLTVTPAAATPDPNDPLSVRVKYIRRPGSDPGSTFQGLDMNDDGDLECIEQGVYAHPVECDKFVSCVSVRGSIILWTYACPNQQLYDDFTGRCLDEGLVECDPVE